MVHTRRRSVSFWVFGVCSALIHTSVAELAAKRGLRAWPKGAGWPMPVQSVEGSERVTPSTDSDADAANLKLAKTQESALAEQTDKQESTEDRDIPKSVLSFMLNRLMFDLSFQLHPRILLEDPLCAVLKYGLGLQNPQKTYLLVWMTLTRMLS